MELALFLALALPASIFIGWHFPSEWLSRSSEPIYISANNTIHRLQQLEQTWQGVRTSKRRVRHLPPMEQAFVMTCTDFEFEWFLVNLWGECGETYRTIKLECTPYAKTILEAEQQINNKLEKI